MRGADPDPRDDVHALGVIWYQVLVGDLTAEAPRGAGWKKRLAAKGMTAPLVELLESCVASDRDDRPKDAGEVTERLAFLLAEPAPGIDLVMTPETRPETVAKSGPEVRLVPPAAPPPVPTNFAQTYHLRDATAKAVDDARWEHFVNALRALLFTQDRLRWSADWWVRVLLFLLLAAVAAGAGLGTHALARSEIEDSNRVLAHSIAKHYSTKTVPVTVSTDPYYSSAGIRFDLTDRGSVSGIYPVEFNPGSQQAIRGRSSHVLYRPNSYATQGEPTPQQKFAEQVNTVLDNCVADYDRRSTSPGNAIAAAFGTGGGVLFVLFWWLRRRKIRSLREEVDRTADKLGAEFPREVTDLAGQVDLRNPTVVRHFVDRLSTYRGVKPAAPIVSTWFHRVFAPF
jgi:hypothetical protein